MNNNQNQQIVCQEDEIDLRELFLTLKRNKKIIFITTFLITFFALVYVFLKNPIPLYEGRMMVEIGEVKSDNPNQTYFDNAYVLKNILEKEFTETEVKIPKRANNIFSIIVKDENRQQIQKKLNDILVYIINRHKQKSKLFDKYMMTRQIGDIEISDTPVNLPKKKLIVVVAFVTGLILSIFLVFFIEFIKGLKEEENNE